MKQSLQLRIGQHLALTPQLQQAIRLLQLSTVDLDQEIQNTLESNPMLESTLDSVQESTNQSTTEESSSSDPSECIPHELSIDTQWSDIYPNNTRSYTDKENINFENLYGTTDDLHSYLAWQLELTPMTDTDRAIATSLLEAIDDRGLLTVSLNDIQASLGGAEVPNLEEITAVLHRIQQFDPPGVAARSIDECLKIQLLQLPKNTPFREKALSIVTHHKDLLAKRQYTTLQRCLNLTDQDFQSTSKLIQSLTPYPGENLSSSAADYITADVIVRKENGQWCIFLYQNRLPQLQINGYYVSLIKQTKTAQDRNYLRHQLQEAKWFLKSIQSRNETLIRVTTCIVKKQQDFLERGPVAMKPLVLNDVAKELNLHESTISRISRQKYMLTPHGTFELNISSPAMWAPKMGENVRPLPFAP